MNECWDELRWVIAQQAGVEFDAIGLQISKPSRRLQPGVITNAKFLKQLRALPNLSTSLRNGVQQGFGRQGHVALPKIIYAEHVVMVSLAHRGPVIWPNP